MNSHWNVLLSWCFGTLVVSGTIWLKKTLTVTMAIIKLLNYDAHIMYIK